MIDINKIPVPKYKVGDTVWTANSWGIKEHVVQSVFIKGQWFDNGYTSRHEFEVLYELSSHWSGVHRESYLLGSKRTAQRKASIYKKEAEQNRLKMLSNDYKDIMLRIKNENLKPEDL